MTAPTDLPPAAAVPTLPPVSRLGPVGRFIADNNPFYVLSAMCMLAGLFILNDSLHFSPIPLPKFLTLIITLNVYEWLLVGLSVFLLRRGILRDGAMLVLMEAFFLADVAFLNAEAYTAAKDHPALGSVINLVLFVLAAAKIAILFRASGLSLSPRSAAERNALHLYGFTLLTLALMFALPGLFWLYARHHRGNLPPHLLYAAWWAVGLLPALFALLTPSSRIFGLNSWMKAIPTLRLYALLPFLSLVAHVAVAHWVYKTPFYVDDLAPLAIGFAVFAGYFDRHFFTEPARSKYQLALPILAVCLSASPPSALIASLGPVDVSSLRLVLVAAGLVYADGLFHFRKAGFASAGVACLMFASAGPSPSAMAANLSTLANRLSDHFDGLRPKTSTHWGVLAVVGSFVLLAAGLAVSLLKRPQPQPAELSHDVPPEP
jgi:hypothetical protein